MYSSSLIKIRFKIKIDELWYVIMLSYVKLQKTTFIKELYLSTDEVFDRNLVCKINSWKNKLNQVSRIRVRTKSNSLVFIFIMDQKVINTNFLENRTIDPKYVFWVNGSSVCISLDRLFMRYIIAFLIWKNKFIKTLH